MSDTPQQVEDARTFRVTHPFHPLYGETLDLITVRHNWGVVTQVYFHDVDGRLRGVPIAWTSLFPEDPVVTFGGGRVSLRLTNLQELARFVDQLREADAQGAGAVRQPKSNQDRTGGVK